MPGSSARRAGRPTPQRRLQWVVDPLDGTVNFLYGLPGGRGQHRRGDRRRHRRRRGRRRRTTARRSPPRRASAPGSNGAADHGVDVLGPRSGAGHDRLLVPRSRSAPRKAPSSAASCRGCATCAASDRRRCRCAGSACAPHRLVLRARHQDLGLRGGIARRRARPAPSSSCPARRTTAWRSPPRRRSSTSCGGLST